MTRKEFISAASLAEPGQKFMIKKASGWEIYKGWGDYWWGRYTLISFDGKEAVFSHDLPPNRRIYVSYREIKSGQYLIVWDKKRAFTITRPTDFEEENTIKLWEPGTLKFYK